MQVIGWFKSSAFLQTTRYIMFVCFKYYSTRKNIHAKAITSFSLRIRKIIHKMHKIIHSTKINHSTGKKLFENPLKENVIYFLQSSCFVSSHWSFFVFLWKKYNCVYITSRQMTLEICVSLSSGKSLLCVSFFCKLVRVINSLFQTLTD